MQTEFVVTDPNRPFEMNRDDLSALMQIRNEELKILLERYHGSAEELCVKLKSDPFNGISEELNHLHARKLVFGTNTLPTKKSRSFFGLLWQAIKEPILIMLIAAALVSFAVALYNIVRRGAVGGSNQSFGWVRSIAIMTAVIINAIVAAGNNYRKEKQFLALQNQIDKRQTITVIRSGTRKQIPANELLVGDICALKDGDVVQADGVLLRSDDLSIDESVLTGESDPVKKRPDGDIRLISGTHVMEGTGKFLVLAVGSSSHTGQMFKLMGHTMEEQTKKRAFRKRSDWRNPISIEAGPGVAEVKPVTGPVSQHHSLLQEIITKISMRIAKAGLIFSILVSLILIIRFCVRRYVEEKKEWSTADDMPEIMNAVTIGITLLVVIIPAGLPLAVSLTLAVSAKKMMKDNNLVRHLSACETMGYATSICSDKTGTLTSNRMVVTQIYIGGQTYLEKPPRNFLSEKLRDLVAVGLSVNSSYSSNIQLLNNDKGPLIHTGNRTECALLAFVSELGYNYKAIRIVIPEDSFAKVYSFNSFRKSMSTIIKIETGWRVFCKGAAENVLEKCDFTMTDSGAAEELTKSDKEQIQKKVIHKMSSIGLRTICHAYKDIPATCNNKQPNFADCVISGLTMLAIFGIEDPVRPEVPKAIQQCKKAGVVVRVITGDNVHTAVQVATKCGIISPNGDLTNIVMDSKDFNKRIRDATGEIDQTKLDKVWPALRVLARATPQDKFVLVDGIINSKRSESREVVAVTGDGTNDAPALRRADVGFAMGIDGTEVAKEASDIILTDDNFNSIVKACMWGRGIYDNICKFLQFQLTVNLVVLVVSLVGSSALGTAPLEAVPMLWINVIQDTMASLALATEPPDESLLDRKPYGRNRNILSRFMIRNIISQGVYQLTVLFLVIFGREHLFWFLGSPVNTETDLATLTFNSFVMMTTFNLINSRCILNERNVFRRIFKNRVFIFMIVVMVGIQAIVVEFGGPAFLTSGLNWREWIFCITVGAGSLFWYQLTICMIPHQP